MTTAVSTLQSTQQAEPLMQLVLFPDLFGGVDRVAPPVSAEERTEQVLQERSLSREDVLCSCQLPLFSLDTLQSLCS